MKCTCTRAATQRDCNCEFAGLAASPRPHDLEWVNERRADAGMKPITQEDLDELHRMNADIEEAKKRPPCECGCEVRPDFGACDEPLKGRNGRCAHCDHAPACHVRDKDRPTFNIPIGFAWRSPREGYDPRVMVVQKAA